MQVASSYIRGIAQRRYRYKVRLGGPTPLHRALDLAREVLATRITEEWGGRLCPLPPPHMWLLLTDWLGGTLPADISLCAPISHPAPTGLDKMLHAAFSRLEVCLEPIAPMGPPLAYSRARLPGVKLGGRIALKNGYAVVKVRGLYFIAKVKHRGDPLGGVELQVARYDCFSYDFGEAVKKAAQILRGA